MMLATSSLPVPARADTISYNVAVSFAEGPRADLFPDGTPLAISYTLDPAAVDSQSDPQRGLFQSAVLSISVSATDVGIAVAAGPAGLAQTFNDVVDPASGLLSDQVFLFGGKISPPGLLDGEPIMSVEVDFLSDFEFSEPTMLSDDHLPLFPLRFHEGFIEIKTQSGQTNLHFSDTGSAGGTPTPSPTSTPPRTNTSSPTSSPTPAGTATASATPGFGLSGNGCMIGRSSPVGFVDVWILLLPSLLALARRSGD
jgi:hypothetical protein